MLEQKGTNKKSHRAGAWRRIDHALVDNAPVDHALVARANFAIWPRKKTGKFRSPPRILQTFQSGDFLDSNSLFLLLKGWQVCKRYYSTNPNPHPITPPPQYSPHSIFCCDAHHFNISLKIYQFYTNVLINISLYIIFTPPVRLKYDKLNTYYISP